MSSTIDPLDERRQAELLGAITTPASLYFARQTPVEPSVVDAMSKDSISKAGPIDPSAGKVSTPVLDQPDPMDIETFVDGRNGMKDLLRKPNDGVNTYELDDMVHELMLALIQHNSVTLQVKRDFFETERAFSDMMEKERNEAIKSQVATNAHSRAWGQAEKAILTFGLIAAGVAGIATGAVPLGVAAITVGTLLLIDQLLDDKLKTMAASWLARGNQESTYEWLNRIQAFCAVVSVGLSLGLTGPSIIQLGITVAKGVTGGVKSALEIRRNFQQALMINLETSCTLARKSVNQLIFDIQMMCDTLYGLYENMHHVEESRGNLRRMMAQLAIM